ncbi:MAG: helix-turn-helix transcriptional regulator [Rhizomicrobium sp.]
MLGAIWRSGPCSAYGVQQEFAGSASSHWSASAGSIYPVIQRLAKLGLVKSKLEPWGKRGKRNFVATSRGERALRSWIGALPPWTGKPTMDPIRTRMNFVAALKGRDLSLRFVDRATENTKAQILALTRRVKDSRKKDPPAQYLTMLGALYELQARLRWLREAREVLRRTAFPSRTP